MGTFLLVNINYILSFAFIDAVVHYNVPDVWNSALWACVVSSVPMGPILHVSWSVEYNVGDKVVLITKHINNYFPHLPAKIKARWVGPFTITQKVSPVAYRVDLPPGWHLHPVFHIDKLKKYIRSEEFL